MTAGLTARRSRDPTWHGHPGRAHGRDARATKFARPAKNLGDCSPAPLKRKKTGFHTDSEGATQVASRARCRLTPHSIRPLQSLCDNSWGKQGLPSGAQLWSAAACCRFCSASLLAAIGQVTPVYGRQSGLSKAAASSAPYTHFGAGEHKLRTGRVHLAPQGQTMSSRG